MTGQEADELLAKVPAEVKVMLVHQLSQLADLDEDALIKLYAWVREVRADLADEGMKYADALYSFGAVVAACSMTIGAGE